MSNFQTSPQRHANMAAIKSKDTKPEMVVRRYLWGHGFRYRLNHPRLPGKPDIVMRKYRTRIFVNGCFWHGHEGCRYYTIPKTNTEFWVNKVKRNKERDLKVQHEPAAMGWQFSPKLGEFFSSQVPVLEQEFPWVSGHGPIGILLRKRYICTIHLLLCAYLKPY